MSSKTKSLIEMFELLDVERQNSLFDFAEFLYSKGDLPVKEITNPLDIPRPDTESVVGAIKRLKETYPMIDSMKVFSSASELMTEHMVKGRPSIDVIDEMEQIFEDFYSKMLKDIE